MTGGDGEKLAALRARYEAGERVEDLAAELGVYHGTMRRWLRKAGATMHRSGRRPGVPRGVQPIAAGAHRRRAPNLEGDVAAEVVRLYKEERLSIRAIVAKLHYSYGAVHSCLVREKVRLRKPGSGPARRGREALSAADGAAAVRLYATGLNVREVAGQIGRGRRAVRDHLAQAGLLRAGGGQAKPQPRPVRGRGVLRWADPPAAPGDAGDIDHDRVVAQLRARSGDWALLTRDGSPALVRAIGKARIAAYRGGLFEARCGSTPVYVRHVGGAGPR